MAEDLDPNASLWTILRIEPDGTLKQVRMRVLVAGDLIHVIGYVNTDYVYYYGKWKVVKDASLERGTDGFNVWGCAASLILV